MQNIIIVGDSFCSSPQGWPQQLADMLDLNCICHGVGGQPWWNVKRFIDEIDYETLDQTEFIVFAHTNSDRIPTGNEQIGRIDHSNPDQSEQSQAIQLYYKYIHEPGFLIWAQHQWFQEISATIQKKLVHLHCFPWSMKYQYLLRGMNITPSLMAISLNEIAADRMTLFADSRHNHLNDHNNTELANQLSNLIKNYDMYPHNLDLSKFDQKILTWVDYI
jgi:hypothetical protein